jgi:hypothetical protein
MNPRNDMPNRNDSACDRSILQASNLAAIDPDARNPVARPAVASHIVLPDTKRRTTVAGPLALLCFPRQPARRRRGAHGRHRENCLR